MAVMNLQKELVSSVVSQIISDFPDISFQRSDISMWEPESNTIFYKENDKNIVFSLLHELGHMMAKHKDYQHDVELVLMESEAWQNAKEIAKKYNLDIDNDHIEDCLDTYRNWLHKRSTCPTCAMTGSQKDPSNYCCLNCHSKWSVSKSRFCRAYRMTK